MRVVQNSQIRLGELAIAEIRIDARSRDDIPAVLRGLQEIYTHDEKREQLFALLEESLTSKTRHTTGRPGMQLWRIFVLATLKQGLNCDFDRLQQYAESSRHRAPDARSWGLGRRHEVSDADVGGQYLIAVCREAG